MLLMGGLPCAKQVIDNVNALYQQLQCMVASIQLNASRIQPTYEMRDELLSLTDKVAKCAAKIEKYVREGEEYDDSKLDPDARW
jgi:DNA anti-recombination protein RmuC